LNWRRVADWAKQNPSALRLADGLGRGHGRLRLLDHLSTSAPAVRKPNLLDWESRSCSAVWLGHATVLLRVAGKTILTDPVFSTRVGVGLGMITAGPKRLIAPALKVHELPKLDLILISHAHFDHLDRPSLVKLHKSTPVVTASRTADLVRDLGFRNVTELGWGQSHQIDEITLTGCEVKHWGARTFHDTYRGYNGYLISGATRRIFYAGDTAYRRFTGMSDIDLAIFGIGAYDPYIAAHATPEQAWQKLEHVGGRLLLPIHHSTFRLSHEPMHEPIERMMAAAGRNGDRVVARQPGDEWTATD
jgi:L-ascorbate metabolism protein UlaG (beta-lactamase superfamily)